MSHNGSCLFCSCKEYILAVRVLGKGLLSCCRMDDPLPLLLGGFESLGLCCRCCISLLRHVSPALQGSASISCVIALVREHTGAVQHGFNTSHLWLGQSPAEQCPLWAYCIWFLKQDCRKPARCCSVIPTRDSWARTFAYL